MGMDVYGKNPRSKTGEYFHRNVWGWRPLSKLVQALGPDEIISQCEYWHSNDGDGLGDNASCALAAALEEKLETGDVDAWIEIRNVELAQLPNEICDLCEGTGIRTDEIGRKMGQPDKVIGTNTPPEPNRPRYGEKGWCNGCNGKGWNPAFAKSYEVDRNDVEEFVAFLKECGGFEIC